MTTAFLFEGESRSPALPAVLLVPALASQTANVIVRVTYQLEDLITALNIPRKLTSIVLDLTDADCMRGSDSGGITITHQLTSVSTHQA